MKKTVTIENLTNRSRTFNLPHSEVCAQSQVCHCENGRPASIFVPAHGKVEGLDLAVRFSGEIKSAASRRPRPDIRVTIVEDKPKQKKSALKPTDGGQGEKSDKSPPQGKDYGKGKGKKKKG